MDRQKFLREFDPKSLNLSEEHLRIYKENPHIQQVDFRLFFLPLELKSPFALKKGFC